MESKKPLDIACEQIEERFTLEAAEQKKMKPILDRKLKELQAVDNKINWHEKKIKELKEDKEVMLRKMHDLLELSHQQTHSLKNGYTVKPDNKRKLEVISASDFMKWLKQNKEPQDVLGFLTDALKITKIKSFCNKEINYLRECGEIDPKIDGIEIGDISYRRLTTEMKEK